MQKLIGAVLTYALGLLFIVMVVVRFDLVVVSPTLWYFGIGIIFAICGGWLVANEFPGGKFFAGLGTLLLVLGGFKAAWPESAKASARAQAVLDEEAAATINTSIAPRRIPCDTSTPNLVFFDGVTGAVRVWIYPNPSGRIECYSRPGKHRQTRAELLPVTVALVPEILAQEPEARPTPEPRPVAVVESTPIPTESPVMKPNTEKKWSRIQRKPVEPKRGAHAWRD